MAALLAFAGLITLAQSTRCYCGYGGAYYNTDGNDPCYFFNGEHKIYNIQGSWETACIKCGEKAIEKMKNAGHCPRKMDDPTACDRECFACVKYSLSGMYMARPGYFSNSGHYSKDTLKCGRTEKNGRSLIASDAEMRSIEMPVRYSSRFMDRLAGSRIVEADRFFEMEPSRSNRLENLAKYCKSEERCGAARAQELGYADSNECARDCFFTNS